MRYTRREWEETLKASDSNAAERSLIARYRDLPTAERAVAALSRQPALAPGVSLLAQSLEREDAAHGYIALDTMSSAGHVCIGRLFCLLEGAAFLWLPGFGPLVVAGPFTKTLLGQLEELTMSGSGEGVLTSLNAWGVPPADIADYETTLRTGGVLLTLRARAAESLGALELLRGAALSVASYTAPPEA